MEKLTEFWEQQNIYLADIYDSELDTGGIGNIPIDANKVDKLVQKLGKYEHDEENGLLIHLPCKEGTLVYEIVEECNSLVCHKANCKKCNYYNLKVLPKILSLVDIILYKNEFNKTIFFTEDEANNNIKRRLKHEL